MSSMTDIVFLLLVFFIIISTMVTPYGLNVLLPTSAEKTTSKPKVTISITPDSRFYIGSDEVSINSMEALLKSSIMESDKPSIILKADQTVNYGDVVKVMDICKRNQYQLVLATKPD